MRRLACRLLGHRTVRAQSIGPMVLPDAGLVIGWRPVKTGEWNGGQGCTRCGRFWAYGWAHQIERDRLGIERLHRRP